MTLQDQTVGSVRTALQILLAAVAMVLLIACANVANLVLVRGTARQSEIAVRAALGASRPRLLRYLLTESFVIAIAGGVVGVVLAIWSVSALKALAPPDIPRLDEVAVDVPTFLFALGVAAFSAVLFGAGPALQFSRAPLASALASRADSSRPRARWTRSALLVAEVSLSVVLLLGAGLLLRSLARLQSVDPGFRSEGVTTFLIALPAARYPNDRVVVAHDDIAARLAAIPGVDSVGRISGLPLGPSENVLNVTRTDKPAPPPGQAPVALYRVVDSDYFRTLGIPFVAGRAFTPADRIGSQPVVIISRRMAQHFWPGEDALGKAIRITGPDPVTIVGVVADVRSQTLTADAQPEMYVPLAQTGTRAVTYVIRSREASDAADAARTVVRQVDSRCRSSFRPRCSSS
jgi:putative ABC transport system permease protein